MATMTLQIAAEANQPPSQPGVISKNFTYNELYTFTVADFTTSATPAYSDPEGDAFNSVKILTVPSQGSLTIASIAASPNDVVTEAQLIAGQLQYQCDVLDTDGYNENFTYTTSDVGSNSFSSLSGTVAIVVSAQVENSPPTAVGNGSAYIAYGETLIFTREMFTTGTTPPFSDPEGDPALYLKITGLPALGEIRLNGVLVVTNEIIDFNDIDSGLLTYVPDLADTDGDMQGFTFQIADISGVFVG